MSRFRFLFIQIPIFLAALVLIALPVKSRGQSVYNIYVSPAGSDNASGKIDEPVKSIEKAQIMAQRATKGSYDSIQVLFRSGYYPLNTTLTFTSINSGKQNCPIVYASQPGEWAVITAGEIISKAELKVIDSEKNIYSIDLNKHRALANQLISKDGVQIALVANSVMLEWSSMPEKGWYKTSEVNSLSDSYEIKFNGSTNFSRKEIWVGGYWRWDWAFSYNKAKISDTGLLNIYPPYHNYGYKTDKRFKIYNVGEMLRTNTFYLNERENTLVFRVKNEFREVVLSIKKNRGIKCNNASNIVFRRLIFEGNNSNFITFNNCSDIKIEGCLFQNMIETPVSIVGGINIKIKSSVFKNIGGKCIDVNAGNRNLLVSSGHLIRNCIFRDFALIKKTYNPAININGVGVTISHNLIEKGPHAGIIFKGNNHIIEYTELRFLATETSDVGVIYAGRDWTYRGNVIRNNYIHNSVCSVEGSVAAIYLDDLLSGTSIENNLIYMVNIGILIGGGQYNTLKSNKLIDCTKTSIHIDNRAATWAKQHAVPGGSWKMWERLSAVNYKADVYKNQYPELANLNLSNYKEPIGNKVIENSYTDNFIDFRKKSFYSLIEISGNKNLLLSSDKTAIKKKIQEHLELFREPPGIIVNNVLNELVNINHTNVQQ